MSLKEDLERLVKLGKRLQKITDSNCHTEAYIAVAKFLGETVIQGKLEIILKDQRRRGSLHHTLSDERYSLYCELMRIGENQYGEEFNKNIRSNL